MDITVSPKKLYGTIEAIASKSQAHRLLICAAFADKPTQLYLQQTNQDIDATADCLEQLGASVTRTDYGYHVIPTGNIPLSATLHCRESGSTLRFMLPVIGALGVDTIFHMEGRLPARPLSPLAEEMERMGCSISRPSANTLRCAGKLRPGTYRIDGSVSSQFITGLMLAGAIMEQPIDIEITGKLESAPYVQITRQVLTMFQVDPYKLGREKLCTPGSITVEGDWSNAAFFLACNKLGSTISVGNLNADSAQGDRAIVQVLESLDFNTTVDCTDIPDLVPVLAVTAAALHGAVFTGIHRLRLKESDRIAAVQHMLTSLGGKVDTTDDSMTIYPTGISGGTIDSCADHRIAMAAAVAATVAPQPVTILGAECVKKTYPAFWDDYKQLGGVYEQHLR